jgi:serine/threonine protein phosphatase PrpC
MPADVPAVADKLIPLRRTPGAASLALSVGCASRASQGKPNEDFCGVAGPWEQRDPDRGVMLALADGVSATGAGRTAAELTVRSLLADYPATSPAWTTAQALEKLLCAVNDWLLAHNRSRRDGIVAAVSALVLRGGQYCIAHVGNTRVYRLRDATPEQLTSDHTWPRFDMHNVLRRAIGLDTHLVLDVLEGEFRAGDTFLILSDGVWDTLGERRLRPIIQEAGGAQTMADALVDAASVLQASYLGRNDASAIVASVVTA